MNKFAGINFGIFCFSLIISAQEIKTVNVPTVNVSTVQVPSLSLSMPVLPATIAPEVNLVKAEVPETENPVAYVPEATDRNTPLQEGISFLAVMQKLFRDQRGLKFDRTANVQNSAFMKWVEIYKNYKKQEHPVYPIPAGIRMIAEVQVNKDLSHLPGNLEFYKSKGYNSVLFVINGKETAQDAEKVCKIITEKGLKLFFAFSPKDHDGELSASVFPDPDQLSDTLRLTALYAEGFLLNWRRTSSHYFLHDSAWDDWMIRTVRSGKCNLPILGEFYQGTTAEKNFFHVTTNMPSGTSGCVIQGSGHRGRYARFVLYIAKKWVKDQPFLAVILGERPNYLKTSKKNFTEHLQIKKQLEEEYLKYGCSGTITLHSDTSADDLTVWQNR